MILHLEARTNLLRWAQMAPSACLTCGNWSTLDHLRIIAVSSTFAAGLEQANDAQHCLHIAGLAEGGNPGHSPPLAALSLNLSGPPRWSQRDSMGPALVQPYMFSGG